MAEATNEWYPRNPGVAQLLQTDVDDIQVNRCFVAHLHWTAVQSATKAVDDIIAAVTCTGVQQVITTGITNPSCCRNLTVTAAGTGGDVGAIQVTIVGTDYNDEVITEVMPIFVVDTPATKTGLKAFKTVTSITLPAHDGTGATTSVGTQDTFGLPFKRRVMGIGDMFLGVNRNTGTPTIKFSATSLANNTLKTAGAVNGTSQDVFLFVAPDYP
ncbi:unnamed protein product [marine sediment metagenome]|uniref:Uncharacterized protein n=1 Tax=marine sediment metagenome TaxID=412755 RepID=X0S801_9ZZZZ